MNIEINYHNKKYTQANPLYIIFNQFFYIRPILKVYKISNNYYIKDLVLNLDLLKRKINVIKIRL